MTSRLKRKLEEAELSSNNLNESFCQIGTPLPSLADSKDKGEYVPLWKQEVCDEQGRKRLHGAFTGGFSAGYYNTVGSKEGWTPSTFTSSRSARASAVQKPEDFMDDEDREALRADQDVTTREGFGNESGRPLKGSDGEGLSSLLSNLIAPSSSDIGSKLLSKLGWKQGQGIGPRIRVKVPGDDEAQKHLFAPKDTTLRFYDQKDDSYGLGWVKSAGLTKQLSDAAAVAQDTNSAFGFGYGIENADEDDRDVYDIPSSGPSSSKSRFAFQDENQGDEEVSIGRASATTSFGKSSLKQEFIDATTWHDGKPVQQGFKISSKPLTENRWFDPPKVPEDWQPRPSRIWKRGTKWDLEPGTAPTEVKILIENRKRGFGLAAAEERGTILGEIKAQPASSKIPVSEKSVFDFVSARDKERLAQLKQSQAQISAPSPPQLPSSTAQRPQLSSDPIDIPTTDAPTANSALRGFMPFADNPAKQGRYKAYLHSQASGIDPTGVLSPQPDMSRADHIRELTDFQQAARIFRPMSTAMSSRFASASTPMTGGDTQTTKAGLFVIDHAARAELQAQKEEEERQESLRVKEYIPENETPLQNAARMGMYGALTRETKPFYPTKLLCKRFGVKDPHPSGPTGENDAGAFVDPNSGAKPVLDPNAWQSKFTHVPLPLTTAPDDTVAAGGSSLVPASTPQVKRDLNQVIGLGEDPSQGQDTLSYKRPEMDIFKAIFEDRDSDSDDDDDEDEEDGRGKISFPNYLPPPSVKSSAPVSSKLALPVPSSRSTLYDESNFSAHSDADSFRPTFTSKSTKDGDEDKDKETLKKKEKKKEKKKKKSMMSFDLEEDDGDSGSYSKKKKRRREEESESSSGKKAKEAEEEVWEEVPPPVKTSTAAKGRHSAVDFM